MRLRLGALDEWRPVLRAFPVGFVLRRTAAVHIHQHVGLSKRDSFRGASLLLVFKQRPAQQRKFLQWYFVFHEQRHVGRHRELGAAVVSGHALKRKTADIRLLPESRQDKIHKQANWSRFR